MSYTKVLAILDASLGGPQVEIEAHAAFWRGLSRDQFVAKKVFTKKLIEVGDGAASNLVRALRGEAPFGSDLPDPPDDANIRRMPAGMDPVPDEDIDFIERWIDDGCPEFAPDPVARVYKIHPAIGVARVGNAPDEFFFGPEMAGSPGVEIGADGTETVVRQYKAHGRVKRQAARFRVFEYERDAAGNLALVGEVDAAQVEWTVDLANRKAALDREVGPAEPRNTGIVDRNRLIIRGAAPVTVSGANQRSSPVTGSFLGKSVYLGELRTDADGRLIVLGGRGSSGSVPANAPLVSFANNDRWHDDVSDGPVTATVTVPGQAPVLVDEPAWVVVGPPDFAPTVGAVVSLYEVAVQVAIDGGFAAPAVRPVFDRDIRPVIERLADMRWVDEWDQWNPLQPLDWDALADPSAASSALREKFRKLIVNPGLNLYELPPYLRDYAKQWAAGDFDTEAAQPRSVPDELDHQALAHCSGSNFLPGIEAGQNLKDLANYSAPFRLNHNADAVFPGFLTEIMALPWQADFRDCRNNWWPSQRPHNVMTNPSQIPASKVWDAPINSYEGMVENTMRLGFVLPKEHNSDTVLVDSERDSTFPRTTV